MKRELVFVAFLQGTRVCVGMTVDLKGCPNFARAYNIAAMIHGCELPWPKLDPLAEVRAFVRHVAQREMRFVEESGTPSEMVAVVVVLDPTNNVEASQLEALSPHFEKFPGRLNGLPTVVLSQRELMDGSAWPKASVARIPGYQSVTRAIAGIRHNDEHVQL